ncbi:hypothetical protein AJ80_05754 [Polytolypa hystricis UAMH7299]|uniref:Uncharacterized protein n=1 Tax=Polytolypa hystricis (strain UAMH7299) TaxID=1447883 RepID=A0A2B7Y1Z4_POLH7|nr:hypothetical protein AJ80_05754 [Polytolypa hystricis UAMH7299]
MDKLDSSIPLSSGAAVQGPPVVPVPQPEPCYPRLEIDTFVKDSDVLNIFLLSIAELQTNEKNGSPVWKSDPHSWFQLAAIHGSKLRVWHRVYLILYEQTLYEKAKVIANSYVNASLRERYTAAATRLRLPYWDPLVVRSQNQKYNEDPRWYIPFILATPYVWLRLPGTGKEDKLIKRPNPLYQYVYPPMSQVKSVVRHIPSTAQGVTVRCPQWANPKPKEEQHEDERMTSDHTRLNEQLVKGQVGHKAAKNVDLSAKFEDVAKLLLDDSLTWNQFSNTDWQNNVSPERSVSDGFKGSIEGWHDDIHGMVGWNWTMNDVSKKDAPGTMADVPNIDRLMAAYQMTHPDQWVADLAKEKLEDKEKPENSAWIHRKEWAPFGSPPQLLDELEDKGVKPKMLPPIREFSSTPLLPFRKAFDPKDSSNHGWWTSDHVRDWTKLGYSYQGIKYYDPSMPDAEKLQSVANGKAFANRKYGWMTAANYLSTKPINGAYPQYLDEAKYEVFDTPLHYDGNPESPDPRLPVISVWVEDSEHLAEQPIQAPVPAVAITTPPASATKPGVNIGGAPPPPSTPPPITLNKPLNSKLARWKARTGDMKHVDLPASKPADTEKQVRPEYPDYAGHQVTAELDVKDSPLGEPSQPATEAAAVTIPASIALDFAPRAAKKAADKFAQLAGNFYEWDIIIRVYKFALNGPFSIFVFLGSYNPQDATSWSTHPNCVSVNYVFANNNPAECDNCAKQISEQTEYVDSICLTPKLLESINLGALSCLKPEDVGPFLKQNLTLQALSKDGILATRDLGLLSLSADLMYREVVWGENGIVKRGATKLDQVAITVYQ